MSTSAASVGTAIEPGPRRGMARVSSIPPVVHIVDDDPSFRTSTSRLLRACGYAVETFESAEELLKVLERNTRTGCILLDIRMPGLSGPELQNRLRTLGSRLPIIFLTGHADIPTTVQVIKAGAEDLLTKPVAKETLLQTIERALARLSTMGDKHEQLEHLRSLLGRLSPRERQVLERVVRGKMNKEIARELGTTERTIKAHRHNLMEKIEAKSLPELVLIAERLGILGSGADHAHDPHQEGRKNY
jgi:RNA polymerase sigma factor (sigma-70 family)